MDCYDEIREHALQCYPEECVGFIYKNRYHRMENISMHPTKRYKLSLTDKIFVNGLSGLQGLVHSHPIMDSTPSETDLAAQRSTGFNFYIIGTNGRDTTEVEEILYERPNQ